ncbi:DUF6090 family protein [Halocola ammonii]
MKIFHRIRHTLLKQGRITRYLIYALGEIVLVVLGILIALQINNANESSKARAKEINYLKNIQTDLLLNIANIEEFIETRNTKIESANIVLDYYEGKPLNDISDLSGHCLNVYIWHKFYQVNNTFLELVNSGNLALISNDSIKNNLLNQDALFKELKGEEEHYRFDTEELLYKPSFKILDLNPITKKYMYDASNGQVGADLSLPTESFKKLLLDIEHKNGFVMAVFEFTVMNGQLEQMKTLSEELMELIDRELQKN